MRVLKSLVAVIVGLAAGILLSVAADTLLFALGVFVPSSIKNASPFVVATILSYRFIFNIISCYLTARLAPDKPMLHALILGSIGFVIAVAGAILMWNEAPPYYNIVLVLAALPAAWIGGRRYLNKTSGNR
jgi:hypothetical protein